jgi:hypothetical protein
MSQQEMGYGEMNRDRPNFSYPGYEGVHFDNSYATGSSGQKLSGQVSGKIATAGQRLALAIVSIVMLMIMTFGLIAIAIATHVPDWAVFPILFILVLFYSAVVIINIVFNRRH